MPETINIFFYNVKDSAKLCKIKIYVIALLLNHHHFKRTTQT